MHYHTFHCIFLYQISSFLVTAHNYLPHRVLYLYCLLNINILPLSHYWSLKLFISNPSLKRSVLLLVYTSTIIIHNSLIIFYLQFITETLTSIVNTSPKHKVLSLIQISNIPLYQSIFQIGLLSVAIWNSASMSIDFRTLHSKTFHQKL